MSRTKRPKNPIDLPNQQPKQEKPAFIPKKVLLQPQVFLYPDEVPLKILLQPVVLQKPAR